MREEQALNDWDKLAETGWQEMRKKLLQQTSIINSPVITIANNSNYYTIFSVCLFTILLNIYPSSLHDSSVISLKHINNILAIEKAVSPKQASIIANHKKEISVIDNDQPDIFDIAATSATSSMSDTILPISSWSTGNTTSLKENSNHHQILVDSKTEQYNAGTSLIAKKHSFLKRVEIFGGAGLNLSVHTANPGFLSWSDINIHPSFTAIIPLSNKFSLHTGIRAMSTIHQRGVAVKNEERVNILGSSYNINTTSIIKASYFDVPLTLHYSINRQWTIGGGVQVSRFYKLNIREEKENYDFNNRVISATAQQYSATASQISASPLQETVNIKRYDARLMAGVSFHNARWLFSAGYYYGTDKNIELKETSGQYHQYRNEYLKLGIEYQLYKK